MPEVMLRKPHGLARQPVEPLKPRYLHPPGRSGNLAADETEADSYAEPPDPGEVG